MKQRADKLLVSLGLFGSRTSARAAIEAGRVTAGGMVVSRPSQPLSASDEIEATPAHPYVSRGGLKLAHALETFSVSPSGQYCLDIGASTGGFTDVLLRCGAKHVVAVDVGRGQLHASLAGDARVTSHEATDARALIADMLEKPPSLLVCDASFISLEKLLEVPLSLASQNAHFVGLFKPQFQVGRENIGKGGLVTDVAVTDRAVQDFGHWMRQRGWPIHAWTASPISGGDGNAEHLFHAIRA